MFVWIPILQCKLHRELFCFAKCLMVIPNLLNKLLWILWPYCDKYGEFIVNVKNKNNRSNFSLNLIKFFEISKNKHHGPPTYKATLIILRKFNSLFYCYLNIQKKRLRVERSTFFCLVVNLNFILVYSVFMFIQLRTCM